MSVILYPLLTRGMLFAPSCTIGGGTPTRLRRYPPVDPGIRCLGSFAAVTSPQDATAATLRQ